MIMVLSTPFMHAGVKPPVNDIEQICRCLGEKSNASNLCHKLPRLLNYAIYACYIVICWPSQSPRSGFLKFELEIRFFAAFLTTSQHPAP